MSEYWKSTPKYWCKHCSAYVKDTPFERKQHESTGKHQGNLKRFLRGIQNDHERGEREKEKVKAEIARLNKVTGANPGTPAETPSASAPLTKAPIARTKVAAPQSIAEQKKQWAQLVEMGIQVPEDFRAELAMPGSWEQTSSSSAPTLDPTESLNVGVRKRKFDDQEEAEAVQTFERKGWGSTTKRYPGEDQDDLDTLINRPPLKHGGTQEAMAKVRTSEADGSEIKPVLPLTTESASTEEAISDIIKQDDIQSEMSTQKLDIKPETFHDATEVLLAVRPVNAESPVLFRKRKPKARNP